MLESDGQIGLKHLQHLQARKPTKRSQLKTVSQNCEWPAAFGSVVQELHHVSRALPVWESPAANRSQKLLWHLTQTRE